MNRQSWRRAGKAGAGLTALTLIVVIAILAASCDSQPEAERFYARQTAAATPVTERTTDAELSEDAARQESRSDDQNQTTIAELVEDEAISDTDADSSAASEARNEALQSETPLVLPDVLISPEGDDVPRLASVKIAFRDAPAVAEADRIVTITPDIEGTFVWTDDRTLLFQPNAPGWQPAQRYQIVVDAVASGLTSDFTHSFSSSVRLAVDYVIPTDGDVEVPANAQILVQFNRSVAPLTVLSQASEASILEFDPPLTGTGEWLNTSLYRFIPADLAPGAEYSARVPAGLDSATEGSMASAFTWRFTTVGPAVTSVSPAAEEEQVQQESPIVVTFNQQMDRTSVEEAFSLRVLDGPPVLGSFSWSDDFTTLTFRPDEPLWRDTLYEITVAEGVVSGTGVRSVREYSSWFYSEPSPRLIRTRPDDGETDSDLSGFSLYYSTPMDLDSFAGRVTVTGFDPADVQVSPYAQWGDLWVGFSLDLEYETTYTVQIAEGVRDLDGHVFPFYEFSFTTYGRTGWPYLSLASHSSFATVAAGREQHLHFHARRVGEVRFQIIPLTEAESELLLRRGFIDDSWNDVTFRPESEPTHEWSELIEAELQEGGRLFSTVLGGGRPLPTGHYLLTATPAQTWSGDGHRYQQRIVVSVVDTAIITKQTSGELVAWALDYDTGEPLVGSELRAALMELEPEAPYQHATTDSDGVARFSVTTEENWRRAPYWLYLVRMDDGNRQGVAATWWTFGAGPWDVDVPTDIYFAGYKGHVFTERPIYRPGETVHYKGVVRIDDDARYSIPEADSTFTVKLSDSLNRELLHLDLQLNELGTLSGDVVLSAGASTGTYRLHLTDEDGKEIATAIFTVADFRAPEFAVDLATLDADVVAGDVISAEARASFFFGGSVVDADVEWRTHAYPTVMRVDGFENYTFWEQGVFDWLSNWETDRGNGETQTDASGIGRFDVPADLGSGSGTQRLTISATVTDANAQAIADSAVVSVHPATWYGGIRLESQLAVAETPTMIHLVSVDYHGQLAKHRPLTVRFYKREWMRTKEPFYYGGAYYRSEPIDTEIAVQTVTTDSDGRARVGFTPSSAGSYRVVVEAADDQGRVARSARFLYVRGERYASWPVRDDNTIELLTDQDSYEVGDVAEVLAPANFAGATALITFERGGVLSTAVRRFETNSEVLRIPIEDWHIPNVYLGVTLYRPPTDDDPYPRYNVGYANLSVSKAARRLDVKIEPNRQLVEPGETIGYNVQVTDPEGRGVEVEIAVAVVDQAVLSLLDELGPDPMTAFWRNRPLGVRTSSSLSASLDLINHAFRDSSRGEPGVSRFRADEIAPVDNNREEYESEEEYEPTIEPEGGANARLRSDFRYTALWMGQLRTDADGRASFELTLPDNATTWQARARAIDAETRVGDGESELLATQPLLVRPALPRFLRVGDEVTLRTLVHNGASVSREVSVSIEADGVALAQTTAQSQTIESGASAVFGWTAQANTAGAASIRFYADSGEHRDAVQISIPVHPDLTLETTATGGVVKEAPVVEAIYLPEDVTTDEGSLELLLQASMVDTLDDEFARFLPVHPGESNVMVGSRIVGAVALHRAAPNGITDEQRLQLESDIDTLVREQRADGGWSWCRGCWRTDPLISAHALIALADAQAAGFDVPVDTNARAVRMIQDSVDNMSRYGESGPSLSAYLHYAVVRGSAGTLGAAKIEAMHRHAVQELTRLTSWARAYMVLALLGAGVEPVNDTVRLLLNSLSASSVPSANGNLWQDDYLSGSMHNGSVRSTALVLHALTNAQPRHPLIEGTVRWLVHARASDRWQSSVERAQAIASLAAFSTLTGENRGAYDYRVSLGATKVLAGEFDVPGGEVRAEAAIALDGLPRGELGLIQFERDFSRDGRMYYTLSLRYAAPANEIAALNRGIGVSHRYSLLDDPDTGVTSSVAGEVVRVEVTVIAPTDRVFVTVNDFLPAGLEPIIPRLNVGSPWLREHLEAERAAVASYSGGSYSAPWFAWYYSPWDQVDLRDDRVTLYAKHLPKGVHRYIYYARATTPGDFFVAPAHAQETFFPEVFGRSDSGRFTVHADE